MSDLSNFESNEEIKYFREFLQIYKYQHNPNINYEPYVEFLRRQAIDLDLLLKVYYQGKHDIPFVVITWTGTEPTLPAIVLNAHMDVVPVNEKNWTHSSFGAEMDEDGRAFARGAQDMKCVGMQYLSAIRALKQSEATFKRTIHITFVADEVFSQYVGFLLYEMYSISAPDEVYPVSYGERSFWRIFLSINGSAGHGSLLHKNTAGEKLQYIVNKMKGLRAQEVQRLEADSNLKVGDATTITLISLNGGVQTNVVPPLFNAVLDVRLAINVDRNFFENQLIPWCEEAGGGISIEYEQKTPFVEPTMTDDSNSFWIAFKKAINTLGHKIELEIFPHGPGCRYFRHVGVPSHSSVTT